MCYPHIQFYSYIFFDNFYLLIFFNSSNPTAENVADVPLRITNPLFDTFFLGIEVKRTSTVLVLTQTKYILDKNKGDYWIEVKET